MGADKTQHLSTSQVAKAVGVHPNTVRLYEEWGFLSPIPRAANNYRQFTAAHVDQMRLARTAMHCTWLGGEIRRKAYAVVQTAAKGELVPALELAQELHAMIRAEQSQANAAAETLERWAQGETEEPAIRPLQIGETADYLQVTRDKLRNWERNGLLEVPRDPQTGYRLYGAAQISRLRVIRTLVQARYSLMAILRMLLRLDAGHTDGLREVLDTPRPEDDVYMATDYWISAVAEIEASAASMVDQLRAMIDKTHD